MYQSVVSLKIAGKVEYVHSGPYVLQKQQMHGLSAIFVLTGFMDPTYILKSAKKVSKEQIQAILQAQYSERTESETYDIYLLPPNEDPETCQSWLRMRNRDGRYNLMFEEWVCDGPFIISPRITFEVCVHCMTQCSCSI